MSALQEIEIAISKKKLISLFVASFIFVSLGAWFIVSPPKIQNPIFGNPMVVSAVGLLSVLFFGVAGISFFKRLLDKSPGLIISEKGIFDNASGVSAGLIPWTDILSIQETVVQNQRFVNIVVKNPEEYINKHKSIVKRKLAQINYKSFGTVIGIPATGLNCNYDELKALLENKFNEFKRRSE